MGAYSVEFSTVTKAELYAQARQLGVAGRSRMNKEELAWAVMDRDRRPVQVRARQHRSSLWAATPAVFRTLAWKSIRMIPSVAAVTLSAAIGATTPMLLFDSPGELGAVMRAGVPATYAQPAAIQPRPVAKAGDAQAGDAKAGGGVPSSKRAARPIVLAQASGDSSTGSASQPRTEALAGGDVEPDGDADHSDDGRADSGEDDRLDNESDRRGRAGSDDRSDGAADEGGKGKGHDKDKDRGKGEGKEKRDGKEKPDGKGKGEE